MPHKNAPPDFSSMLGLLEMLKYYHDIGIYDNVVRGVKEVREDDRYEFADRGLEFVAPYFDFEQVPMGNDHEILSDAEAEEYEEYCEHWHAMYRFSSPEMREYYRLCRLYEHRERISPEENPFVRRASLHCAECARAISAYLWFGFDCELHTRELLVEICPDEYCVSLELVRAVHDALAYYGKHVRKLALELKKGPPVHLPALPAPKGEADGELAR
jgi:hypothetical protein